MAHWFHRNPLKASKAMNFDNLKTFAKSPAAAKLCGELRVSRAKLLQQLCDSRNDPGTIEKSVNEYLSLLLGLCENISPAASTNAAPQASDGSQSTPSKGGEGTLRRVETFKWTDTICGNTAAALPDAYFELISILIELALWYTKRSSYMASNASISEDDAKEVHKGLRQAAGIFIQAKNMCDSKLGSGLVEKHGDTDPRVLDAYHLQSLAEAQEVTVARAVELKHKSHVISAVASETSKLFGRADDSLKSVDPAKANKWRKYLQIKKYIYLAYAHSFKGEELLGEDKCGEAIKSLQEADKCYSTAGLLCREYAAAKGAGTSARPSEHQFYIRLGPIVQKRLEKATHENGFIYHQKVPAEVPELPGTDLGVASPIEYSLPSVSPRWTKEIFSDFDLSKMKPADQLEQEKLDPVKEVADPNIKHSSNETGCSIS